MTAYRRNVDETRYVFFIKNEELLEKYKSGTMSEIRSKKNLIVNIYTTKNIEKLK